MRAPSVLTVRRLRALPIAIGVLLAAQVTAVATAGPNGVRLDQPATGPAAGPNADVAAADVQASPSISVDAGPVHVSIGLDASDDADRVAGCGAGDRPETGVQGDVPLVDQLSGRAAEGYNCGVQVVGYSSLGQRSGNANMAWAGHCAYIAGVGVAVVDVSDPLAPKQVATLTTPGSAETLETIAARTAPDGRSILVAGRYGFVTDFHGESTSPIDIYDVTDCTRPKLLSTARAPQAVHNLTLTSDLTRIWSTLPLQAIDISDPTRPVALGTPEDQLRASGAFHLQYAHEVTLSPDDRTMYIGGQVVGDEGSLIVDIGDWPQKPPRVIASYDGPGHSIREATVNGRKYLLRSDEAIVNPLATGCLPEQLAPFAGPAQPYLTDITDPAHPADVSRITLEINDPSNCATQLLSGVNSSSHYHDVDDPTDTTFAMVSMWNAGLRIFDVRNPAQPVEVAYFNPGMFPVNLAPTGGGAASVLGVVPRWGLDQAWAHVRYVPETGQIWLTTRIGGFWVLELEPQIRSLLALPSVPSHPALEGSPRPLASREFPQMNLTLKTPAGLYCTLAPIQQFL